VAQAPDRDLFEVEAAARIGRGLVSFCLLALAVMWTIQLYRGGGTSGLLADVHDVTGDAATGASFVVAALMVFSLFRRDAKVVGGLAFSLHAGMIGVIGGLNGHPDVGLMFVLAVAPLGLAVALMAKAGR